jgi:glycosyltransferase involved in cell wall biosynthesis
MKNKILIDASTVTELIDGLSRYIINLIEYIPESCLDELEFTVLVNSTTIRPELYTAIQSKGFKILKAKIAPIGPMRDWNMYWFLRKHAKDFDLIHIPTDNFPVALRKKGIGTIHDMTFKKYFSQRLPFKLAERYMDWVIRVSLKRTISIIAISYSTKDELTCYYHLPDEIKNKIRVIHHGSENFESIDKGKVEECMQSLITGNDYIYYLGSSRKHKNLTNLLLAIKLALPEIPTHKDFVISGNMDRMATAEIDLVEEINKDGRRVFFTGRIPDELAAAYFNNCDAVIFPSLSEGFGFGVLEAFYYKKPLLCSNISAIPEVAGDAAIYFDPHTPESIAQAIITYYQNPAMADALVEKGIERMKQFSWKDTAEKTVIEYKNCLKLLQQKTSKK